MDLYALIRTITELHRNSIIDWYEHDVRFQNEGLLRLVEENHAFNFQLWQAEDRARRDDQGHIWVYHAKRAIDGFNQQRNNRMESIDEWITKAIQLAPHTTCPVHSETPGMMIDRLSILSLKSYHMAQQTTRAGADSAHHQACADKWVILQEQYAQLTTCLLTLIQECIAQTRTFRLYHQFKMYNDPMLNPELYANAGNENAEDKVELGIGDIL